MSAFKEDSDIFLIKRNAGSRYQKIHEDTYSLIEKSVSFGYQSNGAFDITIRPLVELWGINKKGSYVPSDEEIQNILKLINYQNIILDKVHSRVLLKNPGQALDLGGIAKGYAADEVKRILVENGVGSALINLGGNVITIGKKINGQQWQIGIQNPLAPTGEHLGVISVEDKTIVTSGSNERFFVKDGVRYHHILDPRTGRPVQNNLLSVTAVCSCSTDADMLTTALFILGPEKSRVLLEKMKAEAIFVTKESTLIISDGLKDNFRK